MIKALGSCLLVLYFAAVSNGQIVPASDAKPLDQCARDMELGCASMIRNEAKKLELTSRRYAHVAQLLKRADKAASFDKNEALADAARVLGLWDVALALYEKNLNGVDEARRNGEHPSPYNLAYKAAICAFWLGRNDAAFEHLKAIETGGDTQWVNDLGREKADHLRKLLAEPNGISQRIAFAKGFWVNNVPAVGVQYHDAVRFLEQTLAANPDHAAKKEIYLVIEKLAQDEDDTETVRKYLERIRTADPKDPELFQRVFSASTYFFSKGNYTESRGWLDWIVENEPPTANLRPLAYLGISEIFEKLGNEAEVVRYLKLAAQDRVVVATNRSIMDTSDTKQTALVRLGKHYQLKRDFGEALAYFVRWQPRSHCGNCAAQMSYERDLSIAQCLVALGRENEALEKYIMPNLSRNGGSLYHDYKLSKLAVDVYDRRGELDAFRTLIASHVVNKENHAAATARDLAEIRWLAKRREVAKLVAKIKHADRFVPDITADFVRESNWMAVAIAEELSAMEGKEVPFLRSRYRGLATSNDQTSFADRSWIVFALGLSKSSAAETFLNELLAEARSASQTHLVRSIEYALSLRKPKST